MKTSAEKQLSLTTKSGDDWFGKHRKKASIALAAVAAFFVVQALIPFASVPTGTRDVITQFGAIKGIEGEGLCRFSQIRSLLMTIFRVDEVTAVQ